MGAVVERAVNGAVETVLAEMLKVVGVKFEELKTQLALMKRDVTALQREKALKEKENDNIRSKLRYTELKLKYYRQGVEEELQQREAATASASTLVHVHQPSTYSQTQRAGAGLYPAETSSSCSTQTRNDEGSQDLMLQPEASQRSMGALPCGLPPRQAVRPWAKDFSLYEEYKLRRNELRRRSLNRRRELEKTLPQPLLADMTQSGAAGLSQTVYSIGSQHQELRASCASTSGGQQRRNSTLPQSGSYLNNNNNTSAALPFMTSSPSLLQQGSIMAAHQHAVTSTSSSSFPQQVSLSQQGFSLTEADVLQ
ncbi:hypothetical protein F2P81_021603 [Scophthalmus maximus]|uniref:Uncharacterized protein n=1 Tax=Scophthalmus maximus TaxID=52904 RepID=A0A6A4RVU3_SCOMX|nr:hypothetical protein F2P81_021603 [Scophthalmus maximus]